MPPYILHWEGWKAVWPFPVAAALMAGVLYLMARPKDAKRDYFAVIFAFALLGMVTGYMTGFSRSPVVGAVLPAVLSLMAGLSVFLVGKTPSTRMMVASSVISFAMTLLIGVGWGAIMRQTSEDYAVHPAVLQRQALAEVEVREFRQALGLPPDPPQLKHGKDDDKEKGKD